MTAVSKDQKSFDNMKSMMATVLANKSNNPSLVGQILFRAPSIWATNGLCARGKRYKGYQLRPYPEIGKQFYGNAKDFTFYFM